MIKGACIRLIHQDPNELRTLLDELAAAGATAVEIVPHHYASLEAGTANFTAPPPTFRIKDWIYPDIGQDPEHPNHNTPDPALVLWACAEARARGLTVLLKPHVDFYKGAWRGWVSVAGHARAWTVAYKQFLRPYINIARRTGADLCMGCELYTVTKELGAWWWIDLAHWIKHTTGFPGRLTYAANWGVAEDAEVQRLAPLWASPDITFIGIDGYYPLFASVEAVPPVEAVIAAWNRQLVPEPWCPPFDAQLLSISAAAGGKPLLFTEIGYPNALSAFTEPFRDPVPGDVPNDEAQRVAALGFRRRWDSEPAFAGFYWWEWRGTQEAISHNIKGRPAASEVFA